MHVTMVRTILQLGTPVLITGCHALRAMAPAHLKGHSHTPEARCAGIHRANWYAYSGENDPGVPLQPSDSPGSFTHR